MILAVKGTCDLAERAIVQQETFLSMVIRALPHIHIEVP